MSCDLYMARKYFADRLSRKRKRSAENDLSCNFNDLRLNSVLGVEAVVISCTADMKEFGHAKFTQVSTDIDMDFWRDKTVTEPLITVPRLLGLELIIYEYDSGIFSNTFTASGQFSVIKATNQEMQTLLVEACSYAPTWGSTGEIKSTSPGSFLVVRKDRKDLHPHHVEGLVQFMQKIVVPAMQTSYDVATRILLKGETDESD